jgi:hypothetical protein
MKLSKIDREGVFSMAETQICPNCHSVNPILMNFCQVCGNKLTVTTPAQPPMVSVKSASTALPPIPPSASQTPMPPVPPVAPTAPYPPVAMLPPAPSIDVLGIKVDEFSDIMSADASRSEELIDFFVKSLRVRNIPNLKISEGDFTTEGKRRHYHIITGPTKTTFLASIFPYGRDLILGWEMYIKRTLKWVPMAILGGSAVILALISFLTSGFFFTTFWTFLFIFLFFAGLAGLLIGKVLKDDWMYLFVEDIDEISWAEASALQLVIHEALLETMETIEVDLPKPVTKLAAKSAVKATKPAVKPAVKRKKK